MAPDVLALDWLRLGLRWLHVIAATVWIGTALHFAALDRRLQRRDGEAWQIHGGGLYRVQGPVSAPSALPERVGRFFWPAYVAWLSGFGLLIALYHVEAPLRLAAGSAADLGPAVEIALSIASLVIGYSLYEALCRLPWLRGQPLPLAAAVWLLLAGFAWGYAQLFDGRAALLHDGALTGTIMVANVAHVMIPGQRRAMAAIRAGRAPDPVWAERARERALHNDWLTLPTVLAMLGAHLPLAHTGGRSWIVFAAALLVGAGLRALAQRFTSGRPAAAPGSGPRRGPR